jgi:hypothetical protein
MRGILQVEIVPSNKCKFGGNTQAQAFSLIRLRGLGVSRLVLFGLIVHTGVSVSARSREFSRRADASMVAALGSKRSGVEDSSTNAGGFNPKKIARLEQHRIWVWIFTGKGYDVMFAFVSISWLRSLKQETLNRNKNNFLSSQQKSSMTQVLEMLGTKHAHKIVHRDIKQAIYCTDT